MLLYCQGKNQQSEFIKNLDENSDLKFTFSTPRVKRNQNFRKNLQEANSQKPHLTKISPKNEFPEFLSLKRSDQKSQKNLHSPKKFCINHSTSHQRNKQKIKSNRVTISKQNPIESNNCHQAKEETQIKNGHLFPHHNFSNCRCHEIKDKMEKFRASYETNRSHNHELLQKIKKLKNVKSFQFESDHRMSVSSKKQNNEKKIKLQVGKSSNKEINTNVKTPSFLKYCPSATTISSSNRTINDLSDQWSIKNLIKRKNSNKILQLQNPFAVKRKAQSFEILRTIIENQIFLVREIETNSIFCLKKCQCKNQQILNSAIHENKVGQSLSHPNIIKTFSCLTEGKNFYHVIEYMEGRTLTEKIHKDLKGHCIYKKKQLMDEIRMILKQIIEGMGYMHEKGLIHRDIKPSNIFLSHERNLKLADFGIALEIKSSKRDYLGTLDYASPEVIKHQYFDEKVDMWAIGCIAYELSTGNPPFFDEDEDQTMNKIVELEYDPFAVKDKKLQNLIENLLRIDPKQRLSCKQALLHPFFASEDRRNGFPYQNNE